MLLGLSLTVALYAAAALIRRLLRGWGSVAGQVLALAAYLAALDRLSHSRHDLGLRRLLVGALLGLVLGQLVGGLWRDRAALTAAMRPSRD